MSNMIGPSTAVRVAAAWARRSSGGATMDTSQRNPFAEAYTTLECLCASGQIHLVEHVEGWPDVVSSTSTSVEPVEALLLAQAWGLRQKDLIDVTARAGDDVARAVAVAASGTGTVVDTSREDGAVMVSRSGPEADVVLRVSPDLSWALGSDDGESMTLIASGEAASIRRGVVAFRQR